jgi:Arc/MetJ-type ribon-helix-helix transcriptional regulator
MCDDKGMNAFDPSSLPEKARAWLEERVRSGLYRSPEEVLASAMQALELFEIQQKVSAGLEQIERGEGREYDDDGLEALKERIKRQGRERLAARRESA